MNEYKYKLTSCINKFECNQMGKSISSTYCHFAPICIYTRVVQKVLQMLGFHRYMRLILAKFVMLE